MKISDTGPIIVLYETSLLPLLKQLYKKVIIPDQVKKELLKKPDGQQILKEPWIEVKQTIKTDVLKILTDLLDEGEAATISLANETNNPVLLDEKKGRRIAKSLNLKVQGTLGVLVKAKRQGLIPSVKDCILKIISAGYYLDKQLIKGILELSNEEE
ncbi:MAG: DUF3368 domain-containing protein [Candidatus Lokiarchaeota archaeon]|nr:DUF3368 domain-containing protein [Candidatus Lokiarchaeota archaeon]